MSVATFLPFDKNWCVSFSLRRQHPIITSTTLVMTYSACVGERLSSPVLHTQRRSLLWLLRMECNNLWALMRDRSKLSRNLAFRFAGHENNVWCLQKSLCYLCYYVFLCYFFTLLFSNVWVLIFFFFLLLCRLHVTVTFSTVNRSSHQLLNKYKMFQLCPIPKNWPWYWFPTESWIMTWMLESWHGLSKVQDV